MKLTELLKESLDVDSLAAWENERTLTWNSSFRV